MTDSMIPQTNPNLDLLLERVVDVPPELVWQAWTIPEHLMKWFTPAPWKTVECEIDLRPGGMFRTVMQSPEGKDFPNVGCYLEIIEGRKIAWTNSLLPEFRPNVKPAACPDDDFYFTAMVSLEPHGTGTRYSALAMHGEEATRKRHEDMGFRDGWGTALDQLVALVKTW